MPTRERPAKLGLRSLARSGVCRRLPRARIPDEQPHATDRAAVEKNDELADTVAFPAGDPTLDVLDRCRAVAWLAADPAHHLFVADEFDDLVDVSELRKPQHEPLSLEPQAHRFKVGDAEGDVTQSDFISAELTRRRGLPCRETSRRAAVKRSFRVTLAQAGTDLFGLVYYREDKAVKRLVLVAVALVTLTAPGNARAALFFLFDRPSAPANERVTVRTGGTPKDFELRQRSKPLQRPVRLYLVRADVAVEVHSRFDPRLNFVGSVVPDMNGRGLLTFSVPPLDPETYTLAYWCPGCAAYSRGRTFFVQQPDQFVQPYRSQALLRIDMTQSCPVTLPNANRPPGQPRNVSWYGNGLLWAGVVSDGIYAVPQDRVGADGSIGDKLLWVTTPRWRAPAIAGERLDAPAPPLRVLGVNQGSFSSADGPSFMSAVNFPAAGCWRLRARVGDLSLSYVVDVVVRTTSTP